MQKLRNYWELPEINEHSDQFISGLKNLKIAVFFDYDGTLTPIVPNPHQAFLSPDMREVLSDFSKKALVAIVSGRDGKNLYELINLPDLFYIGNHGFDIKAPQKSSINFEMSHDYSSYLEDFLKKMTLEWPSNTGILIEPKKYSVAIHYRHVSEALKQKIIQKVKIMAAENPQLKLGYGKQVIEVLPNIDWDKGKAILWLIKKLNLNHSVFLMYFGDDLTDENAFRVMPTLGTGILVGHHSQKTYADYRIKNPEQLKFFLKKIMRTLF